MFINQSFNASFEGDKQMGKKRKENNQSSCNDVSYQEKDPPFR